MYNYPYTLIVIDGDKVPATKQSCIAYVGDNAIKNKEKVDYYLPAVEEFFEYAGIDIGTDKVEEIAYNLYKFGVATHNNFKFELM